MIKAPTYSVSSELIAPDLIYQKRVVYRHARSTERYAFGRHWGLLLGDFPPGALWLGHGDEFLEISGSKAVWLPPFSIVQPRFAAGDLEFECFASIAEPPAFCPKAPSFFTPPSGGVPRSVEEIFHFLARGSDWHLVALDLHAPAAAKRVKRHIDERFCEPCRIPDLLLGIGGAHEVLARHFKRTYGFSPVEYRSKLRVMSSLWLLLAEHYSVTDAGFAVGFQNLSGYYRHFKREVKLVPSRYRLS